MPELRKSSRLQANADSAAKKAEPPSKKTKTETNDSSEIQEGDKISDITLLNEEGQEVNILQEALSKKCLVIFAFPKASTPGCTKQACGFQDNFATLQKLNAKVFGLSSDSPKAQKNFQTKQHLEYSLLSDPEKKLIGPLGAKKSPSGIKRSHWIFVHGILKVKKINVSPQDSFESARKDIESFTAEGKGRDAESETETKDTNINRTKNEQQEENPEKKGDTGDVRNTEEKQEPEKETKHEEESTGAE